MNLHGDVHELQGRSTDRPLSYPNNRTENFMNVSRATLTGVAAGVIGIGAGFLGASFALDGATSPPVCSQALDAADSLLAIDTDTISAMSDLFETTVPNALRAASTWDSDALDTAAAEVSAATDRVETNTQEAADSDYPRLRQACKDAS